MWETAGYKLELVLYWIMLALASLAGLSARLAMKLFNVNELPPSCPDALVHWRRRRMYMAVSEICALPAFATGWMAASMQWQLATPIVVLGSMCSGALGFGFLIHALQTYVTRRVNNG
jgi:hypothetical protein